MDLKMKAEDIQVSGITWDVKVNDGIVPIISGEDEDLQCATIASFLIKGTVPLLPEAGVPWTEYLTNNLSFGELDFYIHESLRKTDKTMYYPEYDIQNDQMTMSIKKLEEEI
jgi:hypothetical protein